MSTFQFLVQPLILLSGVALLILSTSVRHGPVEAELQRILSKPGSVPETSRTQLYARVRLFRFSFLTLYGAAGLLVITSLVGAILEALGTFSQAPMVILICISFLFVLAGVASLCLEVFRFVRT